MEGRLRLQQVGHEEKGAGVDAVSGVGVYARVCVLMCCA